MHIIPLILIAAAAVVFGYDFAKTKGLVALGLCLLTVALTLHFVIETSDHLTLG